MFRGLRVFEYALWQKNEKRKTKNKKTKTQKCRKSTESFINQKIPIFNSYHYQKTAKKLPIWYLSTIFGFNNQKSYLFQGSMLSFVDNFKQHFESCVLIIQNPFEYALEQNTKTRKRRKSSKSPLNQKRLIVNSYHQLKSYQFGI